jgi:hypothetical protein
VEGFDREAKEYAPLLEEAKKLASIRHSAVHAVWLGLTKRGALVAVDIETRKQSPNIGRIAWSEQELITAVDSIDDLTLRMRAFARDYGFREALDFS